MTSSAVSLQFACLQSEAVHHEGRPLSEYRPALDANGNTEVINAAGSLTTYAWDSENRMTVVQLPGGSRRTATYDGDGKRRSYEDSVMLRKFIPPHARRASWDGQNILLQTDLRGTTSRD